MHKFPLKNILPSVVQRYSVTAITLCYDFALLNNAFQPSRTVIASNSYRSVHIGAVIASYSYRSDIIDKRYHIYSLSLSGKIIFKSKYNNTVFAAH